MRADRCPVWLFSSGPTGRPDPKPEGDLNGIDALAGSINARGHRTFAGRLDRSRLGIRERLIVSAVRAPDGDFRDWEEISAWAREIVAELIPTPALAHAG